MANLLSWLGNTAKNVEKNVGNFIGGAERGVQRNIVNPVVRQVQQAPQQIANQAVRSLPGIRQVADINDTLTNAYKSLPKIQQQQVNNKLQQFSNTIKPVSQFAEGSNQSFLAGGGRDLTNLAGLVGKIGVGVVPGLGLADQYTKGGITKGIDSSTKIIKNELFPEAGKKNSLSPTALKDYNSTMKAGRLAGSVQKVGSEQAALMALSGGAGNAASGAASSLPLGEGIVSQVVPKIASGVASGATFGGLQGGLDGKSVPDVLKQAAGWGVAGGVGSAVVPLIPNVGNIPFIRAIPRALGGAVAGAVTAPLAGMTPEQGAAFGLLGGSEHPYATSNVRTNGKLPTLEQPRNKGKYAEKPIVPGADIKTSGGTQRLLNQAEMDHYAKTGNIPANADGYVNLAKPGQLGDVKGITPDRTYLVTFKDGLPIDSQAGPQAAIKGQINRKFVKSIEPYVPPTTAESLMQAEKAAQPKRSWIPDEGGYVKLPGKKSEVTKLVETSAQAEARVNQIREKIQKINSQAKSEHDANGDIYLVHSPENQARLDALSKQFDAAYEKFNVARYNEKIGPYSNLSSKTSSEANIPKETPITQVQLNTERLNVSKETKKELAQNTSDVVSRLSNKEVQSLAVSSGIDTRSYTIEQTRKKIAEQLNLRQETVTLANQAEAARLAGNTEEAARLIKEAAAKGNVSRSQGTDLARQLAARRIIADELATPQQRLFKLLDAAGVNPDEYSKRLATVDFNNANEVIKAYRDLVPAKFTDWIDVVRYNSMLSSPLTQIVNVSSTAGNIAMAPIEEGITGTLDHFRSILTGGERKMASGEGRAYAGGMIKGVKDGLKDFKDTLKGLDENLNVDVGQGGFVPVKAFGDSVTHDVLSFPGRLLGAFDNFHRAVVAKGSEAALAKRAAAGIKVGNVAAEGAAEGAYRTFNQELGNQTQGYLLRGIDEMTGLVMKARASKNPVVKWPAKLTLPFVRIGSNLLKQGIEYSPAGLATIAGAENKTAQLSKAIMGTAVFGAAGSLIGHNRLTWAEPTDPKQKAAFREAGMQPYSVKIGGNWVGFAKLPPIISFNFAMAAALDDAVKSAKINENGVDNVMSAVAKYGNFLADQSYVKNVGDMLAAVKGDAESVTRLVSNYPQQFVPWRAFSGWLAKMSDSEQRMINTNANFVDKQVESLMQQIPGLRQKTTARLDTAGNPLAAQHPTLNAFSPVPVSTENPESKAAFNIMQDRLQSNKDQAALTKQAKEDYKAGKSSDLTPQQKKTIEKQIKEDTIKKTLSPTERQLWDYSNQDLKDMTDNASAQKVLSLKSSISTPTNPKDKYQQALDSYNADKKNGTISDVKDIVRQKELNRLKAQSTASQDAVDLYSQPYKSIVSFVTTNKNGSKLWDEVKALDKSMVDAGYTSKLYNKNGSLKATVAKGRSKGGAKKGKVVKLPNFKITGKSVAYKKVGAPKAKLPISKLPKIKINKMIA